MMNTTMKNFDLTYIPKRSEKPRKAGVTMMMDKGLSLRQAEDFLSSNREHTDIIKLGFGTSIITPNIADKIKFYQINKKEFNQASFDKLGNNSIQNFKLESKDDDSKFEKNSVEILYSMPLNAFTLVSDYNDNIFVAKTVKYEEPSFSKNSKNYNAISNEASSENRNTILKSFDYLLNDKYKVVINEKTLERVKNYFR